MRISDWSSDVCSSDLFVRWGAVDGDSIGTTIGCDNVAGGRDAAQHLIAHGRTRIAFLGDVSGHYPELRDRYRGLCEVQAQHGLPVDPAFQVDALTIEDSGYEAARRLLDRDLAVDAIFAASDMIAIGALRALDEAGLVVPDDVAVIGFDDLPAASLSHPPPTTERK